MSEHPRSNENDAAPPAAQETDAEAIERHLAELANVIRKAQAPASPVKVGGGMKIG